MKIPGGLFDNGLPIGILMFLGTAYAVLRRKFGRRRAAQRFPDLAAELGLDFAAPRYAGNVGVLSGTYAGRAVRIDPDDQRLIKVRFHGTPRVDLRTYENSLRPPFDMVTVHSGDREFDRFFKTRFASEDVAAAIATAKQPGQQLAGAEIAQGAGAGKARHGREGVGPGRGHRLLCEVMKYRALRPRAGAAAADWGYPRKP